MTTATEHDTLEKVVLQPPKPWVVILYNDDYTPVDFVIELLMDCFHKSEEEASEITMKVHNEGSSVVSRYTKDVAQTKAALAMTLAASEGHPLRCEAQRE